MELNNLNILLRPKSDEDIIRGLSKLSQKEKNERLIDASRNGRLEVIKLLIKAGADVNVKDKYEEYTPLIWASINNYLDIVKMLLEADANINVKNKYGNTALTYAFIFHNKEVIDLLKSYGAK